MFAPIEPFQTGFLQIDETNSMYWELSGNPKGKPALFLHGGPGAGGIKGFRKMFDPEKFLIIYLDQRGCGQSRPTVNHPSLLEKNNTQELISDIEKLREHLKIEKWLITGGSWGTTLALAYAQTHTSRVTGIVVSSITTTSEDEVVWLSEGVGQHFPKEWAQANDAVKDFNGERLIDRYYTAITSDSLQVREQAALDWCKWEDVHMSLDPNYKSYFNLADTEFNLQFATLVLHYFKHSGFLTDKPILENMNALKDIPGVMIHGRYDVSSPLKTAWDLNLKWPKSQLIVIEEEGHGGPKMSQAMCEAISGFA